MSSLTQTAKSTKRVTLTIVGIIVFSLVLKILFSIFGFVSYLISAAAPVVATNSFGQIPNIQVNALPYTPSGQIQFVLNTPNGGYPQEPNIADVYKYVPNAGISLLSSDNATKIANQLGFKGNYLKLSDSIYDWKSGQRDFVYNLQTNQYRIVNKDAYGQIGGDLINAGGTVSITKQGAILSASNIMTTLGLTTDFDLANPSIIYLKYGTGQNVQVQPDSSDINAIRIVFFRSYKYLKINDVKSLSDNKLTLLSDNPLAGSVSVTVDSDAASVSNGILEMNYSDWAVDSNYSTYNIKTPQQAWQDVQNGSAYMVYLVKNGTYPFGAYQTLQVSKFQAENIALAYFDGTKQQDYLQPVYVIQGTAILSDGSSATFYFYDPAVI